jgi:RNA polymerase sigma factor (sigma-70 family)
MVDRKREPKPDAELVDSVLLGSLEAWHEFVARFSGLVVSVVRRYVRTGGEDVRRTLFVDILGDLYQGKLRSYDRHFALSTWVVVVSRSRCLDYLRQAKGRRRLPKGVRSLSSFDQEVYRLYYLEGLSFGAIADRLSTNGGPAAVEEVARAMARIDDRLDSGTSTRLAYDLAARSVGMASGRLLQYLDDVRVRTELRQDIDRPDFELAQRETRDVLRRVESCVRRLSQEDQRALQLRYYEGRTAESIAKELDLGRRRRAYTVLDRALGRLRRLFEVSEVS